MSTQVFIDMTLEQLHDIAAEKQAQGYRYVQTMCTNTENGVDLMHSFFKDGTLENYQVRGLQKTDVVPSISDLFFSAFVFENEAHDLFGVTIENIAIDFGGRFYDLAISEPMTVISPEKKAAMDKAKKLAAAKAAKEAKAKAEAAQADEDAELEAKLAAMDPEKAAKVRAAMEAKKAKAAKEAAKPADEDAELEAKLAAMDPEKAAKVRAAMEAKKAKAAKEAAAAKDAEMEAKLAAMDPEKAAKVRAAMAAKAAKAAAEGAGE